jgi:hypothetical protein
MSNSKQYTPSTSQSHLQAEMASDLHWALSRVPVSGNYYDKLDMYAAELIENYYWSKAHEYSSVEQLDILPVGSRILTANDCIGIKKTTGWALMTHLGQFIWSVPTENIELPALSVQSNYSQERNHLP